MQPSISATIDLIRRLHAGEADYTGAPYWHHPLAVMNLLPECASDDERRAALLHDVIEHGLIGMDDLRHMGFGDPVLAMLELVTRRPEKGSYHEYVAAIAASGDVGAIRVKLSDNLHNSDPARIGRIPCLSTRRKVENMVESRYTKSIRILSAALCDA